MMWITGKLPVKYRCWIRGLEQYQTLHNASVLQKEAIEQQWDMWEKLTDGGSSELRGQEKYIVWIGGLLEMLKHVGWKNDHIMTNLRYASKEQLRVYVIDIIRLIKDFALQELKADLLGKMKYAFLVHFLPYWGGREWLHALPRGARTPVARVLLANHRMVSETGRWRRWERRERLCPWCAEAGNTCTEECHCDTEECLGDEQHYMYRCPQTEWKWG